MKIEKIALNAVLALASFLAIPSWECTAKAEDSYNVYIYAIRGPVRSNPDFDAWSVDIVSKMYRDRSLEDDVGYRLMTSYITQPEAGTDMTLWYPVRIVSKDPEKKISLSMLRFKQSSSDPDNILDNTVTLDDPGIIYTPRAMGVIWGEGGERVNDIIITQGSASDLVDEIVFIGLQSKYIVYTSEEEFSQIDEVLLGYPNFSLSSSCEVLDESGDVVATANKTLQMRWDPMHPVLTLTPSGEEMRIGINLESGRTAVILSRPRSLFSGAWKVEATVNAGDQITRPMHSSCYFNAYIQ